MLRRRTLHRNVAEPSSIVNVNSSGIGSVLPISSLAPVSEISRIVQEKIELLFSKEMRAPFSILRLKNRRR